MQKFGTMTMVTPCLTGRESMHCVEIQMNTVDCPMKHGPMTPCKNDPSCVVGCTSVSSDSGDNVSAGKFEPTPLHAWHG